MKNNLGKLKFNALISFIYMIIFLCIGAFISEIGNRIGGFNSILFIGRFSILVGFIFIVVFSYNIVKFFNASAYGKRIKK